MDVPVVVKAGTNLVNHSDPWHARMVQCKCERSMDYNKKKIANLIT